jgi:hypothetical protein
MGTRYQVAAGERTNRQCDQLPHCGRTGSATPSGSALAGQKGRSQQGNGRTGGTTTGRTNASRKMDEPAVRLTERSTRCPPVVVTAGKTDEPAVRPAGGTAAAVRGSQQGNGRTGSATGPATEDHSRKTGEPAVRRPGGRSTDALVEAGRRTNRQYDRTGECAGARRGRRTGKPAVRLRDPAVPKGHGRYHSRGTGEPAVRRDLDCRVLTRGQASREYDGACEADGRAGQYGTLLRIESAR